MEKVLIIGRRSNLSKALATRLPAANIVASDDIEDLVVHLDPSEPVHIIYNTFVKSSLLRTLDDPVEYSRYTFEILAKFVSICRACHQGIRSIIYTSSSSVYGDNSLASELDHCEIRGLYPAVKLASEFFLQDHLRETSIRVIVPRVFNMYGGQDEFSIVAKIAHALRSDTELVIANEGEAIRDFIAIDDIVDAYVALMGSSFQGVINIGTGKGMSVRRVIEAAERAFDAKLKIRNVRNSEILVSVAAIDRLRNLLPTHQFRSVERYYADIAGKGPSTFL
jgi:nucleoside-diphosphate-sugar epimerase